VLISWAHGLGWRTIPQRGENTKLVCFGVET
jgi:hypothetical protein